MQAAHEYVLARATSSQGKIRCGKRNSVTSTRRGCKFALLYTVCDYVGHWLPVSQRESRVGILPVMSKMLHHCMWIVLRESSAASLADAGACDSATNAGIAICKICIAQIGEGSPRSLVNGLAEWNVYDATFCYVYDDCRRQPRPGMYHKHPNFSPFVMTGWQEDSVLPLSHRCVTHSQSYEWC